MFDAAQSRPTRAASYLVPYTLPVVVVAVAAVLRLLLDPFITWKAPFVFFVMAILLSARYGGRGPGLLATALSILSAVFLFVEPRFSFRIAQPSDLVNLSLFAAAGGAISLICGQLRDALRLTRDEAERLRLISDTIPQFLWTARPDGVCDFSNARWSECPAGPPGGGPGSGWMAHVHPDDQATLAEFQAALRAGAGNVCREFRIQGDDGVYRWFQTCLASLRAADGTVVRWFGSHTDIQDSKEQQERFEQIVASAPGIICKFVLRPDGSAAMPFASASIREIYDLAPEAVAGDATPIFERIHPDDRERVQAGIARSAESLSIWQDEFRVRNPSRGELWIAGQSAPKREPDGSVGWYGFVQDRTGQKRAEEALRKQTERELNVLRTLVERAPMGIVMLDRSMRFIEASSRALDDARMAREDVIGKTHEECFPDFPEALRNKLLKGLAGETAGGRDERLSTPDGREHWLNWQVTPWGDAGIDTGGIVIYAEDITDRKRSEAAAQRLETRYRALFENMSEGLAYCRVIHEEGKPPDYVYLSVNRAFIGLSGAGDVSGSRMSEVQADMVSIGPEHMRMFARVAASGQSEKCETWNERLREWFSLSAYSPERGYFVLIFEKITARKKAERAALQWQRAFEQSETAIVLTEAAIPVFQSVNQAFARMMGYTRQELIGSRVEPLFPPEEIRRWTHFRSLTDSESGHSVFESQHVRKDGSRFPVSIDSTVVRDERGNPVGWVTFLHDLTRAKKAEADLREREHTVRALLDSASEAIFAVDREDRIVLANRMAGTMFGYPGELAGLPLSALLPDGSREVHAFHQREFFGQTGVRRLGAEMDLYGRRLDGAAFPVEISLSHIETEQGPLAIAFVLDVTERRAAERAVRELNAGLELRVAERTAQLEAANRELESFAYSVSHDLRAPLRGIDGWSLALQEDYGGRLDEQAHKYLSRVRGETQRMGVLIDDLLELSRVTRVEMKEMPVDLSALADRVAAELREANPGRRISFEIEPGLLTRGDPRLLKIVLTNLLDNAVKFTGTRDTARIEFAASRNGRPGFVVRDNGAGFDSRHADMLFRPFQRLHKASEFPGTGIGLATIKRVIHRHRGEVWAESEPGRGAVFGFSIGEKHGGVEPRESTEEENHA